MRTVFIVFGRVCLLFFLCHCSDVVELFRLFLSDSLTLIKPVINYNCVPLRDFLPRGNGIVTRRPLVLQLVNSKAGEFLFCTRQCLSNVLILYNNNNNMNCVASLYKY